MRLDATRLPEKMSTDRTALDALLDATRVCHVGLVAAGAPLVLPTAFCRDGDRLLIHGSTGSRWLRALSAGADACVTITTVDALVVARSAFESSMHYRSAVLFGRLARVADDEREAALGLLTEHLLPGRTDEVRRPTAREIAATLVLAMPIGSWSLRISAAWPDDPDEDVAGNSWAGVVPLAEVVGPARPAPGLRDGVAVPPSVQRLVEGQPW